MAHMWPQSLIPQIDANGDPLVGAQAFFFDENTTTPQATYSESSLSEVSDHDDDGAVITDANGRWPAIFLSPTPGTYRARALTAEGTVLFDVDGVSVPQDADFVPPDAGETSPELLLQTGMIVGMHGTGAKDGFVRGNGRSIGNDVSGATERANDDTEDLYTFLYNADTSLAVATGRGANAASDFAAGKALSLPDYRGRGLVGLADMGNSASTALDGTTFDGAETKTTLGATFGADVHQLVSGELPAHTHSDGTLAAANHGHPFRTASDASGDGSGGLIMGLSATNRAAFTGTPTNTVGQQIGGSGSVDVTGSTGSIGSDTAHPNTQPSVLVTLYIKL